MKEDRLHAGAELQAECTARLLVERHGADAFDFAARQVAILHLANRTSGANSWRAIAMEIELITRTSH
jgi:hypothetical protein